MIHLLLSTCLLSPFQTPNLESRVNELLDNARNQYTANRFDEAEKSFRDVTTLVRSDERRRFFSTLAECYRAGFYEAMGRPADSQASIDAVKEFEATSGNLGEAGHLYWRLGWNLKMLAQTKGTARVRQKAISAFRSGERAFSRLNWPVPAADCQVAQGLCLIDGDEGGRAVEFAREALKKYSSAPLDHDMRWGFGEFWRFGASGVHSNPLISDGLDAYPSMLKRTNASSVYGFGRWLSWAYANSGEMSRSNEIGDRFLARIKELNGLELAAEMHLAQGAFNAQIDARGVATLHNRQALDLARVVKNENYERTALGRLPETPADLPRRRELARKLGGEVAEIIFDAHHEPDPLKRRNIFEVALKMQIKAQDRSVTDTIQHLAYTYPQESEAYRSTLQIAHSLPFLVPGNRNHSLDYYLALGYASAGDWKAAERVIDRPNINPSWRSNDRWVTHFNIVRGRIKEMVNKDEEAIECFNLGLGQRKYVDAMLKEQISSRISSTNFANYARQGLTRVYARSKRWKLALDHAEKRKSTIMASIALRAPRFDETRATEEELARLNHAKIALDAANEQYLYRDNNSQASNVRDQLALARREHSYLLDQMLDRYPLRRSLTRSGLESPFNHLDKWLGRDECFVSYAIVKTGWVDFPGTYSDDTLGPTAYLVISWVDGKNRKYGGVVSEATENQIMSAIKSLNSAVITPSGRFENSSKSLYNLLIAPLRQVLKGKRKLIVSADGPLWNVPFAALKGTDGHWLGNTVQIVMTPAISLFAKSRVDKRQLAPNRGALILANPFFGDARRFGDIPEVVGQRITEIVKEQGASSALTSQPTNANQALLLTRGFNLVDLPGSELEARNVAKTIPSSIVLLRHDAQESTFKKQAPRFRILHVATHGVFNDVAPLLSSVVMAVPRDGSRDDGLLTAEELMYLPLRADLVVLSACNSGQGRSAGAESLIGMLWALSIAGADSKVLAKWSVDDRATSALMTSFYVQVQRGKAPEAALAMAASALRARPETKHPYYWAPFVVYR